MLPNYITSYLLAMSLVKNILAMGITVGLSDKDAFVKKVSEYIQAYQDDPEKAELWAQHAVNYLEQIRDDIRTQNSVKQAVVDTGMPNKEKIDELTVAIKQLTEELQKNKK